MTCNSHIDILSCKVHIALAAMNGEGRLVAYLRFATTKLHFFTLCLKVYISNIITVTYEVLDHHVSMNVIQHSAQYEIVFLIIAYHTIQGRSQQIERGVTFIRKWTTPSRGCG